MKKKGLSTVVTTLIIILLVLVAVGIVWVIIRNVISEGAEEISLGKLTIDLQIKNVNVNPGDIDIKIKRNPGKGDLSGIKFLVSDGVKTEDFEMPTTMGELAEQTFTLNYSGLVKDISIAPILKSESGKEFFGNEIDKETFSEEEVIKNIDGLVSWWRFEGNANDEISDNDGTINGADCDVNGKYGKACDFDGIDDYVYCGNDISLFPPLFITVAVWINLNELPNGGADITQHITGVSKVYMRTSSYNQVLFTVVATGSSTSTSTTSLSVDQWFHLVGTYDGNSVKLYVNGVLEDSMPLSGNIDWTIPSSFQISGATGGTTTRINGQIDEPMIFKKALSEEEIKALYELDLS